MSKGVENKADMAQEPTDGQLVFRVRSGQAGAFDELVRRYQRRASAVAYRLLNNRDDTMEVSQEAFLRAYDKLDTLDKPERFGPWLMRILSNLALNRRRSRSLRKMASLDAPHRGADGDGRADWTDPPDANMPTPLAQVVGADMRELLARAIDALPEMQKQALIMFSLQKMPQKQVAEILDCSVEAVKWHVFTARKKLKDKLADL